MKEYGPLKRLHGEGTLVLGPPLPMSFSLLVISPCSHIYIYIEPRYLAWFELNRNPLFEGIFIKKYKIMRFIIHFLKVILINHSKKYVSVWTESIQVSLSIYIYIYCPCWIVKFIIRDKYVPSTEYSIQKSFPEFLVLHDCIHEYYQYFTHVVKTFLFLIYKKGNISRKTTFAYVARSWFN